jgi:hypothetical protein
LQEIGINNLNEADLLQHVARCRRLARALSDEVGRRALLDLSAECENIAARLGQDRGVRHHRDPLRAAGRVLDPLPLFEQPALRLKRSRADHRDYAARAVRGEEKAERTLAPPLAR